MKAFASLVVLLLIIPMAVLNPIGRERLSRLLRRRHRGLGGFRDCLSIRSVAASSTERRDDFSHTPHIVLAPVAVSFQLSALPIWISMQVCVLSLPPTDSLPF